MSTKERMEKEGITTGMHLVARMIKGQTFYLTKSGLWTDNTHYAVQWKKRADADSARLEYGGQVLFWEVDEPAPIIQKD